MKAISIALTTVSFLASAFCQDQYYIPPDSIPLATRQQWCTSQETQCPLICLQIGATSMTTRQNDCIEETLSFSCVCANGISPNISQYSLTLPYFQCTEWGNRCVDDCGQDSSCASNCREDHPCGAQDPSPPNKTVIAASKSAAAAAATTKENGVVHTGFADGSVAGGNGDSGAGHVHVPVMFVMSGNSGLAVVFGAIFLGFALFL